MNIENEDENSPIDLSRVYLWDWGFDQIIWQVIYLHESGS